MGQKQLLADTATGTVCTPHPPRLAPAFIVVLSLSTSLFMVSCAPARMLSFTVPPAQGGGVGGGNQPFLLATLTASPPPLGFTPS
jgi:hypothetical protein